MGDVCAGAEMNRPQKVLLVMEAWGLGGTEIYVAGLVDVLLAHGLRVQLAVLRSVPTGPAQLPIRCAVVETGLLGLFRLLRAERHQVVNLHLYASLLPVALLCRIARARVVTTLHMPLQSWGWRHRQYWNTAIRLSSVVLGVSHAVCSSIRGENVDRTPVPGRIGAEFFSAVRAAPVRPAAEFAIAAVGRLSKEKDWATLVDAVGLLSDAERQRVIVNFYGSGPLETELVTRARLQCVRAQFHGHVGRAVLAKAVAACNVSVLPSRFEGLGLAALESMAAGVPIITADFAASNDFVVEGVTGHTFRMGDARGLADRIMWHMKNAGESRAIGNRAREYMLRHFSPERSYAPYLSAIAQGTGS
jgi:glycosyltransferase involved in cell wall biosynthesis